jgi:hypothetical protein
MPIRKFIRDSAFNLARRDVAMFLKEHEEDLLQIFSEELQRLDDEIPEESTFIDIDMVGLGEVILKSALRAISRFLMEEKVATEELAMELREMEKSAITLPKS